jgi:hypothetical protein
MGVSSAMESIELCVFTRVTLREKRCLSEQCCKDFTVAHGKIACGKSSCRTCGGSSFEHGPYWYGYYSHPNGSTGKVYIGKNLSEWCRQWGIDRATGSTTLATRPPSPTSRIRTRFKKSFVVSR